MIPKKAELRRRRNRYSMLEMWYGEKRAATEIAAHTFQPRPAGELLDDFLRNIRKSDSGIMVRLRAEWSNIIGAAFSRLCEPDSLKDGILVLKVRHSALLVELRPSCDIICRRINSVIGENTCREIHLTV